MTKLETILELTRRDAQELHRQISTNIARADEATWNDVALAQQKAQALAGRMKQLADEQAGVILAAMDAAIARLEESGRVVEEGTVTARADIRHANAILLDGANKATQSLSHAVATMRAQTTPVPQAGSGSV